MISWSIAGSSIRKGVLDKAFIKKIFFDVTLDHRIQVLPVPVQGTGCMIDMDSTDQMNCDGIFCLHGSDSHVQHIPCREIAVVS